MATPNQSKPACPRNYLVPSVLVTLFAFLPVGIAAIVFASQVESKYNQGDYTGSQSSSNTAKTLCIVGAAIAAPFYLLLFSLFGFALVAPSFSDSAQKAKESEAKVSIGSINRSQQFSYVENERFASNLEDLGLDYISSETRNYIYNVSSGQENAIVTATAKNPGTRSFVGAVFYVASERIFATVICQTERPSQVTPGQPKLIGTKAQCPSGTSPLE